MRFQIWFEDSGSSWIIFKPLSPYFALPEQIGLQQNIVLELIATCGITVQYTSFLINTFDVRLQHED
ncbi:MAG: hypothetical protein AVDCRST_MAG96-1350 [uncultured Segetibacter sp.]|uniref:Uncharacterized protein n=1 Tax=uncultured Segetibacter sp. TaxID=481133 RepID=A0A6J4S1Z2_9BACT|nr:MAG: hypothetical protein AVDCRST_MAG96-1350 [uncultured Segetibacter sp.]